MAIVLGKKEYLEQTLEMHKGWSSRSIASGAVHWGLQKMAGVNCAVFVDSF